MNLKRREPLTVSGVLLNAGTEPEASCVIALEEQCPACNGSGDSDIAFTGRYKDCGNCGGRGVVLTEQGTTILEFVMAHLKSGDSNILIVKKL